MSSGKIVLSVSRTEEDLIEIASIKTIDASGEPMVVRKTVITCPPRVAKTLADQMLEIVAEIKEEL